MNIIDTHVHIWDFEQAEYTWLEGDTSILNRTYSIEELAAARTKTTVTGGILVQAANNFEDTDWMLQVAAKTDWIKAVVGWVPLLNPNATAKAVDKYSANPYFKGVRHLIHNETDPRWLLQQPVLESLQILADKHIPYDLVGINTDHLQTALEVAARIPELKMVFDHLNQPPIATKEQYGKWGELMQEAAKHSHFYAKISGLGTTSGNFTGWTAEDIKPYIAFALEHFGEDRCFMGGDWPVSLLAGSYAETWTKYTQVLEALLNKTGQQKVYSENAATFYNL